MPLSELLLVCIDFVQFATHLSIATAHLPSENVTALGCGTGLALDRAWSISVNLSYHLHLIWIVHDELFGVTSIVGSVASRNNFTLRSDSRYFIVVFLYW